MESRTPTLEAAEAFLDDEGIDFVRFEQSDLHGLSRSKTVPRRYFRHFSEEGLNFFGGLLGLDLQSGVPSGTGYMDERRFADQLIRPDLDTLELVPWEERTARVICEPSWYSGDPAQAAPRYLMRQMLDRLASMGYGVKSSFEYELYIDDAESRLPVFEGIQIFWTLRNNFDPAFVQQVLDLMPLAGVDIITSNAEYGPGQFEINYAPSMGVTAGDVAFTFKNGIKELGQQSGYLVSFMTKPYADQSASGCHYHHSLMRDGTGDNAFADPSAPDGLSPLSHHWIAGQLAHAGALSALGAPTVNCAKRFKLFSFAPMNATWGFEDRTAALRVKGGPREDVHLENRIPCAASNPYLVAAGVLAAGILGIKQGADPPPPTETIAYVDEAAPKLPPTLDAALEAFEADQEMCDLLGEEFVRLFLAVKRHEIAKARAALPEYGSAEWPNMVTDWEREMLFEYL